MFVRHVSRAGLIGIAICIGWTPPALRAQQTSSQTLRAIADDQRRLALLLKTIETELSEIRNLLRSLGMERPQAPLPRQPLELPVGKIKGQANATVAVLEFGDFECPFCVTFVRETLPQLTREYVVGGKIKVAFSHLPLADIHPLATRAAQVAECGARQGKFWEVHDRLFAAPHPLEAKAIDAAAAAANVNVPALTACLASGSLTAVQKEASTALSILGRAGTPTFIVGTIDSMGTLTAVRRIDGAKSFSLFRVAIDEALGSTRKGVSQ
jgi:protein-disulfide isomerase